jgi:acyl-coenzyme A thioesterase PaaI-like protein
MTPELRQVLKGLAHNRTVGFNFPANFMEVSFDHVTNDEARLSISPGPHCIDRDGQVSLPAFGLLADLGLAAPIRNHFGAGARMATVALTLQFTGRPRLGPLTAVGSFDGLLAGAGQRQGLSRLKLYAGDALVCTGTATFMGIGGPDATPPLKMRTAADYHEAPLEISALMLHEREVLARAEQAMKSRAAGSFIQRFMDIRPRRTLRGAVSTCMNGLQIGNRVGHAQGGITLALAAATADCALGDDWMMSSVSAFYVGPAIGKVIKGRSQIVHRGGRTAVVRTVLSNDGTTPALQVMSSHARREQTAT